MTLPKAPSEFLHDPVLCEEVLACLVFPEVRTVFDGTLGLGGHAEAILKRFPHIERYIACDLDQEHLQYAQKRLARWETKLDLHQGNFSQMKSFFSAQKITHPMVILLDLGLCSRHVDIAEKGFSFAQDATPLRMTFDATSAYNAETFLAEATEKEIAHVLRAYGEEPAARKIARAICETRIDKPLRTAGDLKAVVESCVRPQDRKKALVRVFQAIRIEVNHELDHLQTALDAAVALMQAGDRMGVIAYHSLEDRIVKKAFARLSQPQTQATEYSLHDVVAPAGFGLVTRKPLVPSPEELARNPRARSAKMRILECFAA